MYHVKVKKIRMPPQELGSVLIMAYSTFHIKTELERAYGPLMRKGTTVTSRDHQEECLVSAGKMSILVRVSLESGDCLTTS